VSDLNGLLAFDRSGRRRTLVFNQEKHFLYSSMASFPKEKNATKIQVEAGMNHHMTVNVLRIKGGINALKYWSTRRKSEWTSAQVVHGRTGLVLRVYQMVYDVMAIDQNIWRADMDMRRR